MKFQGFEKGIPHRTNGWIRLNGKNDQVIVFNL